MTAPSFLHLNIFSKSPSNKNISDFGMEEISITQIQDHI